MSFFNQQLSNVFNLFSSKSCRYLNPIYTRKKKNRTKLNIKKTKLNQQNRKRFFKSDDILQEKMKRNKENSHKGEGMVRTGPTITEK